jgi:hypothetical protein
MLHISQEASGPVSGFGRFDFLCRPAAPRTEPPGIARETLIRPRCHCPSNGNSKQYPAAISRKLCSFAHGELMERMLVFSSLVSSLAKHASSMSGETNHCGMSPLPNRVGLSIVRNEGARSDYRSWSQKVEAMDGMCAANRVRGKCGLPVRWFSVQCDSPLSKRKLGREVGVAPLAQLLNPGRSTRLAM